LAEKLNSFPARPVSVESRKYSVKGSDSWLRHFIEQLESVADRARVGSIGGNEGSGGVRVRVETGFEEMGMEDLSLRRGREMGACFEENGEGEGVRSMGGGR
jgi:hypothetical protein